MKKVLPYLLIGVMVVLTLTAFSPAAASQSGPAAQTVTLQDEVPEEPPVEPSLLDIALLITITAFVKQQFALKGKVVILAAFVIGLVIYFDNLYTFPTVVEQVLAYIKLWVGAMGSVDLFKDVKTADASEVA